MAIENVNTIDERRSKSLEIEFSIAICRPTGDDKWQSKTLFLVIYDQALFLAIFGPHSLIVKNVFDCHLFGVNRLFLIHGSKNQTVHSISNKFSEKEGI